MAENKFKVPSINTMIEKKQKDFDWNWNRNGSYTPIYDPHEDEIVNSPHLSISNTEDEKIDNLIYAEEPLSSSSTPKSMRMMKPSNIFDSKLNYYKDSVNNHYLDREIGEGKRRLQKTGKYNETLDQIDEILENKKNQLFEYYKATYDEDDLPAEERISLGVRDKLPADRRDEIIEELDELAKQITYFNALRNLKYTPILTEKGKKKAGPYNKIDDSISHTITNPDSNYSSTFTNKYEPDDFEGGKDDYYIWKNDIESRSERELRNQDEARLKYYVYNQILDKNEKLFTIWNSLYNTNEEKAMNFLKKYAPEKMENPPVPAIEL